MIFLNRETGKLQVFSPHIPDLGFPSYSAYLKLYNFHQNSSSKNNTITLNQCFTISGEMKNTDFPYVTSLKKMQATAEEIAEEVKEGKILHYFGGAVIVDNLSNVKLSIYGGYKMMNTQQLMVECERSVRISNDALYNCAQLRKIIHTSGGVLLQRINTSPNSILNSKQSIINLGTMHLGGPFFAAVEDDITKPSTLYLLYIKAGQFLSLITLRDIDIVGMCELRGIVLDTN